MKILLVSLNEMHHVLTNATLKKALEARGHEVSWELLPLYSKGPWSLAEFFDVLIREGPFFYHKIMKRLEEGFDLFITEPVIFTATKVYEDSKIPWVLFSNLPVFSVDSRTPLIIQASIPEFEFIQPRPNLKYVGFVTAESVVPQQKPAGWDFVKQEIRPIVHVTQGTIDKDPSLLVKPTFDICKRDYGVLSFPIQHCHYMPFVDIFVTNGGFGGVSCALKHGVPMVIAGETEDKPYVAQKVEKLGVGIDLKTKNPSMKQIKRAVDEVYENSKYANKARDIADIAMKYDISMAVEYIEDYFIEGAVSASA